MEEKDNDAFEFNEQGSPESYPVNIKTVELKEKSSCLDDNGLQFDFNNNVPNEFHQDFEFNEVTEEEVSEEDWYQ